MQGTGEHTWVDGGVAFVYFKAFSDVNSYNLRKYWTKVKTKHVYVYWNTHDQLIPEP